MQENDKAILNRAIEKEGFDYAMTYYSRYDGVVPFNHIHDKKFHQLRKAMVEARKELHSYCQESTGKDFNI